MANKRKPISKKTRYEVFKRDKFTCQYCGKSAPDVVLEVDHIVPVAKGGDNSIINLITSCMDCNRGKGKRELSDDIALKKEKQQLDDLQERKNQIELMAKWRAELLEHVDLEVKQISDYIGKISGYSCSLNGQRKIRLLLNRQYSFEEIIQAIDISYGKYYIQDDTDTWEEAFNKIGGVLYNRKNNVTARRWYYGH